MSATEKTLKEINKMLKKIFDVLEYPNRPHIEKVKK